MLNWKLSLDLLLTAAAACSVAAVAIHGVESWTGTVSFLLAALLLCMATIVEAWRLPLLIPAHWAICLGLGASIEKGAIPMNGMPLLVALASGLAIYALACRRWRGYLAYWKIHGEDWEGGASQRVTKAGEPVGDAAGMRQRIEPRFD